MSDNVKIKVGVQQSGIKTGLAKIRGEFAGLKGFALGKIGGALGAIGLATGAAAGIKNIVDEGGKLQDLSERFDVPAEALQRIGNVAAQSGSSMEGVAKSMNKLVLNQDKATDSSSGTAQALRDLGIDAQAFAGLSAEDAFNQIADATYSAGDRGKAYAAVVELMGKQAGELFTTLELGSAGIRAASDEMGVFSDKTVETLDRVGDKMDTLKKKFVAFAANLIAPVLDILVPDDPKADAARKAKKEAAKKAAGIDTEGDGSAGGSKNKGFAADSLTRAGGGGIAYFGGKADPQRESAKSLANIEKSSARQEALLSQLNTKVDPAFQKQSPGL